MICIVVKHSVVGFAMNSMSQIKIGIKRPQGTQKPNAKQGDSFVTLDLLDTLN